MKTVKEHPDQRSHELKLHRGYDDAFKQHAIELVEAGKSVTQVARELGVSTFSIHAWRRKRRSQIDLKAPLPRTVEGLEEENRRLRQELDRSRQREEILKKSLGIVCEPPASAMRSSIR